MTDDDDDFEALLEFLKDSRGFDFTGYKRSSLMRRVSRRTQALGLENWAEYLDYIQVHQTEYAVLFNTVLINVTAFFRDQDSWLQLRDQVLPQLIASKKPSEKIRVWCAGCATGEEPYSIAMLLADALEPDEFRDRVKIYATDIDDEALAVARQATYSERVARSVPAEYLERYFEPSGSGYVFTKALRRNVIFGRNDLVQDAPISRVDLLSCRNTLMYLNAETQARVLTRFNFALNDTGVLFLGKAEMLLSHSQLFAPLDLKRRLFRRVIRSTSSFSGGGMNIPSRSTRPELLGADLLQNEAMLAAPTAAIVVTADSMVAGVNRQAEALFGVSVRDVGRPFPDLELSYRPVELRPCLEEARRERRPVWIRDVEWNRSPGERVYLDFQVVPLIRDDDGQHAGTAIYVSDVSRHRKLQDDLEQANRQVETAYEELQSTVEELETTNEELQSTVEELETTNEELQSTNEELETMNEELQSTNDELQSINDELRERTDQLDDANFFLQSILRSLRSGVIVVDADLVVRVWNSQAEDLWGLRPEEAVGQHLLNLDIGLSTDRLRPLIRQVLADGQEPAEVTIDAVNRKGRPVQVRFEASSLVLRPGQVPGALVIMDQLSSVTAAPVGEPTLSEG